MPKGIVISGKYGEIVVREKSGEHIELGELLVADSGRILMQAYDLLYGSQISQSNLELISGMKLEEDTELSFFDERLRSYNLAMLKNVLSLSTGGSSKSLPRFFSEVREVTKEDLSFLTKPKNPMFLGKLRSGSKEIDVEIFLPSHSVLSHHILIPASTGRGKSNLASVMLWDILSRGEEGVLVLDPHDEYYGRHSLGLKDHRNRKMLSYYSARPPQGGQTLRINLRDIKPEHFSGVMDFSTPQKEALTAFYRRFKDSWIDAIVSEKELPMSFSEGTLGVVRRRMLSLLDLEFYDGRITSKGIFDTRQGETTISDICQDLESSKVVIVDTSSISGPSEVIVGVLLASEIFRRYRGHKNSGTLESKPVISIFLEEAPRVLGRDALQSGTNVFETIAREGRKFHIGLTAITQLPSLIPREILANMNTKIILGLEMSAERQAIIDSASQDLSSDSRAIAALDKGEAIVSSTFARFAIPLKIPLFSDFAKKEKAVFAEQSYHGIQLE